jgi:hypothetical protein
MRWFDACSFPAALALIGGPGSSEPGLSALLETMTIFKIGAAKRLNNASPSRELERVIKIF